MRSLLKEALTKKGLLVWGVAGTVLVLDWFTKVYAVSKLRAEKVVVIPQFFELVYVENKGAAWGMLGGLPATVRIPFFVLVSIVAVSTIIYLVKKAEDDQVLLLLTLGMVLGGAVGNLIDRLRQAYVVDFLDFYVIHGSKFDVVLDPIIRLWCWIFGGTPSNIAHHWPAFNIADIGISVGVTFLLLESFINEEDEEDEEDEEVIPDSVSK